MNRIEEIEKKHLEQVSAGKKITEFFPGDTIKVNVRIVEGKRQRVQAFEGVCIAKKMAELTLHSQSEKFLSAKVLKECSNYIVQT